MRTANIIKTAVWITLLAGMSVAGIKYVAVVESDIDEGSGASENISRADVRLVTAELRREAVKNLPPKRYVIMTAETVMAQGGAVLEECADENCVITLGSKIGADYIVRGTVSKLESLFTLQVEMYETENGNLVASCDPVRSESIRGLVEKASEACATMYKAWLASQAPESEQVAEKHVKKYVGANYTLVNSPQIKSAITPSINDITYRWGHVEAGQLTSFGLFYGVGLGLGFGTGHNRTYETTISFDFNIDAGYTFRLPADFTLSPGGSIGVWGRYYAKENKKYVTNEALSYMFFGGPFTKARWTFIEVSYRGIIGHVYDEDSPEDPEDTEGDNLHANHWNWVNEVRAGLYFEY